MHLSKCFPNNGPLKFFLRSVFNFTIWLSKREHMLHVVQKSIFADLQGCLVDKDPYGKHSSAKFVLSRNMWMFFFVPSRQHTYGLFAPKNKGAQQKASIICCPFLKISMAFGAMIWAWINSCSATIHMFFCFVWLLYFFVTHSCFFLGKNILLFFLTGPQKWFDQIWSNTCFWSKLITYDFSFPRKKSDFFHCCVLLVGNKILLTVFQELSMGFGWKLFWVVNALLWNLSFFFAKKMKSSIWDLHVKFSDLRIWS